MAPRDHDGADRAMRLVLAGGEVYLAAAGRLVLIDGPDHLGALIDKVLLVTAPPGMVPHLPVEAMRALTRAGDRLRIETAGLLSGEPIEVAATEAPLLVTLLSGDYKDRWMSENFDIGVVNTGPEPCEIVLDMYLPLLDDDLGDAKQMVIQTGTGSIEVEVHRGGPTPVALPVETVLQASFRCDAEPYAGSDARSRGVLVASIRGSSGQVADVFHLSTYFD
ncbi:MAG: hypothetical protein ACT4OK_03000 [Gemmobacter sp.]